MKKLLILTGNYYPKPSANGICIHQIAKALIEWNYEIHVVCFRRKGEMEEETFEGVVIHRVKPGFLFLINFEDSSSILKKALLYISILFNRLKIILFFPLYPLISPITMHRYYKVTKRIQKDNQISNVLAQYCPIEASAALYQMKRKNKSIKSILYVVDSFTNTPNATKYRIFEHAGWKWEKRLYRVADLIINMEFHEQHHQNKRYDKYRPKMILLGLPLVQYRPSYLNHNYFGSKRTQINCVFTGTLNKGGRNPQYLCELFKRYHNNNLRLHFFSRGDCHDMLSQYENESNHAIIAHQFLPENEIIKAQSSADILVNIGNTGTQMVPSKLFSYISYGKPIIHIYRDDNDSCLTYLRTYPLAICIKENASLISSQEYELLRFIKKTRHKTISYRKLKKLYYRFTPEYSADVIDYFLSKDVNT